MKDPFFSIIIPTLNEERFLPRLMTALAGQSYRSFEVIVVDGKSRDKTVLKASRFSSKLPALSIYSVDKRNVSYQRNYGASKAVGDYLLFFDADVLIPASFLAELRERVRQDKPSLATTWMKPDSHRVQDELLMTLSNLIIKTANSVGRPLLPGFNILVKREVFEEIGGFDTKLKLAEDHEMATRAAEHGYPITIYRTPVLTASFRRLRHVGTLNVVVLYTVAGLYLLLKGPIKEELFYYPMGGHLYDKQAKRKIFTNLGETSIFQFLPFNGFSLKSSYLKPIIERSKKEILEKLRSPLR